jgi:outer membrane protein
MKKVVVLLASVFAVVFSLAAYADDMKIGVVDVRQVLQNSPQVKQMQTKLQDEFGARDKQIQAAQQQMQANVEKLNRDGAVMSASDRNALIKTTQTEQTNLREMQATFQKDVYAKQNAAMQNILAQVQEAVSKIAKEKNLTLVLSKEAVAYAGNDVDITSDVAKQFQK